MIVWRGGREGGEVDGGYALPAMDLLTHRYCSGFGWRTHTLFWGRWITRGVLVAFLLNTYWEEFTVFLPLFGLRLSLMTSCLGGLEGGEGVGESWFALLSLKALFDDDTGVGGLLSVCWLKVATSQTVPLSPNLQMKENGACPFENLQQIRF